VIAPYFELFVNRLFDDADEFRGKLNGLSGFHFGYDAGGVIDCPISLDPHLVEESCLLFERSTQGQFCELDDDLVLPLAASRPVSFCPIELITRTFPSPFQSNLSIQKRNYIPC
jgi:hypothetical protein